MPVCRVDVDPRTVTVACGRGVSAGSGFRTGITSSTSGSGRFEKHRTTSHPVSHCGNLRMRFFCVTSAKNASGAHDGARSREAYAVMRLPEVVRLPDDRGSGAGRKVAEVMAPPACAVTGRRSRTRATGGVSRDSKRLSTEVVLLTCCRQCSTPR